jgi:hypothetical protein
VVKHWGLRRGVEAIHVKHKEVIMLPRQLTQVVISGLAAAGTAASILAVTPAIAQDTGTKPASNETKAADANW